MVLQRASSAVGEKRLAEKITKELIDLESLTIGNRRQHVVARMISFTVHTCITTVCYGITLLPVLSFFF